MKPRPLLLSAVAATVLLACEPRPNAAAETKDAPRTSATGWQVDAGGRASRAIPDRAGAAQLVLSGRCRQSACPLVIVSHGRGGAALNGITHPPFDALLDAIDTQGFALLLSDDAGGATWGNQAALASIRRVFDTAQAHFKWDGRVYTLGVSMGGLPATLTAYRQTLGVPVRATATIAGRVNLADAVHTSAKRAASLKSAYGGQNWQGHDPVNDFPSFPRRATPLLTVVSPDDTIVDSAQNGERLARLVRQAGADVKVVRVRGQHLTHGFINADVGRQIGAFFKAHP